jgi:hypothetical protein
MWAAFVGSAALVASVGSHAFLEIDNSGVDGGVGVESCAVCGLKRANASNILPPQRLFK